MPPYQNYASPIVYHETMRKTRTGAETGRGRDRAGLLIGFGWIGRRDAATVLAGAHVAEEVRKKRRALVGTDAVYNLHLVVKFLHLQKVQNRTGTTGFRVRSADDDPVDAGLHQGARAHLAGL